MTPDTPAFLIVLEDPYGGYRNSSPGLPVEPRVGQMILLHPGSQEFGRSIDSKITIRLPHTSINRRHARLWYQDETWHLEDLWSCNGTFVNGVRVPGTHARLQVNLKDRDQIRMAAYDFWFRLRLPERTWLTPAVLGLARDVSVKCEFHLLPILADALEEAGCDEVIMLDHCRTLRRAWRVSWVAELLCEMQSTATGMECASG